MTEATPSRARLTDEQAAALAVVGANVALSAGAGSGKTSVLTERFVRALEGPNPVPLGRVVALTFTNKAARELRDRIRHECRLKVDSGADPAYWRGVVRGLAAARIGTFHAFCGEVLRGSAIAAGVDPGFSVLDEPVAAALRDEALAVALRERLAHRDRDLIELAVEFGLGAVRQALDSLLNNRSGGDLDRWANAAVADLVGVWLDRFHESVRPALLNRVQTACAPVLDLIAAHSFDNPKAQARLGDFALAVGRLDQIGPADPIPPLEALAETAKVQGLTAKGIWPSPEVYAAVKDQFTAIREAIKKVKAGLDWDEETSRTAAAHGIRFAGLARHARETFDRLKRDRSAVDNDDLLLLTRDLVAAHNSPIRASLAAGVDLILVDEFQDTDPIQGEILDQIAGAGAVRMFFVGDFKQSIYRFRGADPELFRRFRAGVPEVGRRNLTTNFRSVPGVLDFVNALFATTFTEAGSALRPGSSGGGRAGPPAVLFAWSGPATPDPAAKSGKPDANQRRRDEARRLAHYLATRLGSGWPIRDKNGTTRDAHAGDVAILFRSLADSGMYEQALVAEDLDFHVVGGSGFFAQLEVLDLINVLSAVEDPTDSVALAGALRSPFFSLSDDALFWLASERPGAIAHGLETLTGERADRLPTADRPRVERARTALAAWRAVKDAVPISSLVDRILSESGYEAALLGEFLGDRKRANARKLVRMARRLDDAGGFTLADFVDRLRADLRAATKETQASTTDDGGEIVRLMSIHQAKGLEFPIVVVPDLDRKRPGELKRVAFDPDLGPLVNPVADADDGSEVGDDSSGKSLGWLVYRHLEKEADDAEALRLFYVATTRARDFLILSAATGPDQTPTSPTLTLLDERFDRASGVYRGQPLPDDWPLPRVEIIPPEPAHLAGSGKIPMRAANRVIPLLAIADRIETAQVRPVARPNLRALPHPPRWVPLDPTPPGSTTLARLDRLCRAILDDPRALDPAATRAIADCVARFQNPVAGAALIDAAVARFGGWLARLPADWTGESVQWSGRWAWTVAFSNSDQPATVFEGWGDCQFYHPDGSVDLVLVGAASLDRTGETLRALLSARSRVERVGRLPDRAWWLAWDLDAEPMTFDRFDDQTLRLAIEDWSGTLARRRAAGEGS